VKKIIVDGVSYVPKEEKRGTMKICVLDRGFVYVGNAEFVDGMLRISNARCLIRWGTTNHLGELANGPLPNTKLGASCNVIVPQSSVSHLIDVVEVKWKH
jgi:hypothetical protein